MGKMLVFMGSEIWSMILCPLPLGIGITKYGLLVLPAVLESWPHISLVL